MKGGLVGLVGGMVGSFGRWVGSRYVHRQWWESRAAGWAAGLLGKQWAELRTVDKCGALSIGANSCLAETGKRSCRDDHYWTKSIDLIRGTSYTPTLH